MFVSSIQSIELYIIVHGEAIVLDFATTQSGQSFISNFVLQESKEVERQCSEHKLDSNEGETKEMASLDTDPILDKASNKKEPQKSSVGDLPNETPLNRLRRTTSSHSVHMAVRYHDKSRIFTNGSYLGAFAYLLQSEHIMTIQTTKPTIALSISWDNLDAFLNSVDSDVRLRFEVSLLQRSSGLWRVLLLPEGRKVFMKHLKQERNSENLEFWEAVERFRKRFRDTGLGYLDSRGISFSFSSRKSGHSSPKAFRKQEYSDQMESISSVNFEIVGPLDEKAQAFQATDEVKESVNEDENCVNGVKSNEDPTEDNGKEKENVESSADPSKLCSPTIELDVTEEKVDSEMGEMAMEIYLKYIEVGAISEVNVNGQNRQYLIDRVLSRDFSPDMFNSAQAEVFALMETDAYSRFRQSNLFDEFLLCTCQLHGEARDSELVHF